MLASAIALSGICSLFAGAADAAEVRPAREGGCIISISGELTPGDYDEFVALAAAMFPEEVLESTAANTVCLDSLGGNLAEGVKFARHFYRAGVGTVVKTGAECHSSCAIMLMMGAAQGPEVAFANRKLHVGGTLGFHRPYLDLPSGPLVDLSLMSLAFDSAFDSALDLISIANSKAPWTSEPMMRSDLMQAMLQHVGNDMYLIDTVDKAARFDVEIVGAHPNRTLSEESAFYVCHNALQWQHGLTEEAITYTAAMAKPAAGYRSVRSISAKPGTVAFEVLGNKDGYGMHRCVVTETDGRVLACGVDEYTNSVIGSGMCGPGDYEGKLAPVQDLALLDPATQLASLGQPKPTSAAKRRPVETRCFVRHGAVVEDDEPCEFVPGRTPEGWDMASFVWPVPRQHQWHRFAVVI